MRMCARIERLENDKASLEKTALVDGNQHKDEIIKKEMKKPSNYKTKLGACWGSMMGH